MNYFVLLVTLMAAGLLVSERLRADLVGLLVLVVLGLSGLLTSQQTFAGFSGSAVMTILGISIISEGLRQTGVTGRLGKGMIRLSGRGEMGLILVVTLVSAGLSLFMNNIAAVGVLLPAVMAVARQRRVSPALLMMPLAFGTLLGGMATLLTTSNIILSGTLKEAGYRPFGLLDFLPVGGPAVVAGVLYMITLGRRWMPHANGKEGLPPQQLRQQLNDLYRLNKQLRQVDVLPGCQMGGQTIGAARFAQTTGLTILAILRKRHTVIHPGVDVAIQAGDRLLVQGDPDPVRLSELNLCLVSEEPGASVLNDEATALVEVILPPHSSLAGRSLRQSRLRERFGVTALAVWREGHPVYSGLGEIALRGGDTLLVLGLAERIATLRRDSDLLLLEEDPDAVYRPSKQVLALVITLLTLIVTAVGLLPVAEVVLAGAVAMLLTGCLEMANVYSSIEWKAIFLIAGMWPLSTAIRVTGLAEGAIQGLLGALGPLSPLALNAVLMAVAMLLAQFMSGQVAALVLAPLALSAASAVGIDPHAPAMAVALGCSLSFPTPFGHPVNLMVMGPGGYTFRDFLRVGLPLTVVVFLTLLGTIR